MFSAQKSSFIIIILNFLIGIILRLLILILPLIFYKKKIELKQIERGFETLSKTSIKTFRINFFFILIIFIIFDLELVLIFNFLKNINIFFNLILLFFVIRTLWIEWIFNKIKWKN